MAIISWNKQYTETLSETLDRFRREHLEFSHEKITYAGRLDPMAEGLLLLLTADDVHKKQDYLGLDKIYEVDFVFGPQTDTYDILGLLDESSQEISSIDESRLKDHIQQHIGISQQKYPAYSSKPVDGKPLFMWAREGKLNQISIPYKQIEIFSIDFLGKETFLLDNFKEQIIADIEKVQGDFRQDKIIKSWEKYFTKHKHPQNINVYSLRIHASSGTYMRSLINEIAKKLNIPACTVKIKRTHIGKHEIEI